MQPSVTVEALTEAEGRSYLIKIGTPAFEANVVVPFEEAGRLKEVRETAWLSGALRIGSTSGVPTWWCVVEDDDERTLSILIGSDDQSWDIALQLPLGTIDAVLREIAACA